MNDLISVIIPVYNVEKYLERCIESVLTQSYKNLEIILVDDGSTDASGNMCDKYAENDKRIRVIHKENGGLSSARNAALDIMTGKYVTFVDSDDFVTEYYVENLYFGIKKTNADMSMSGFVNWYENDDIPKSEQAAEKNIETLTFTQCAKKVLYQDFLEVFAPAKLYTSEIFANLRYPMGRLYEDVPITWNSIKKCKTFAVVNKSDYIYLQRESGIQRMKFSERKFDLIKHWNDVYVEIKSDYPQLEKAIECRYFSAIMNLLFQIPANEYEDSQVELWNMIKKFRKSVLLDRTSRKKARYAAMISFFGKTITKKVYNIICR